MNIGFSTLFAYRPHVEHMYFLSQQLEKSGYTPHFFNCPGFLSACYTQKLKNNSKLVECSKCMAGSLYSYTKKNTTFINKSINLKNTPTNVENYVASSSYTLTRIENPKNKNHPRVLKIQKELSAPFKTVSENTLQWIKDKKLSYVFIFNGRMDITRAIVEACKESKIKFSCIERTWFGDGIQITPQGNCLDLSHLHELSEKFMPLALNQKQVKQSAAFLAKRFKKNKANNEWRVYHNENQAIEWPLIDKKLRILIIPSSKNEQMGQKDWEKNISGSYTENFLKTLKQLNISTDNCVLRAHPNWGQRIGAIEGSNINAYYKAWAKQNNIHYIDPADKVDTSSLIKQADLVLLNGSSAVYECAFLGTPSVCIGPCHYSNANISNMILSDKDFNSLNLNTILNFSKKELIRRALRFIYIFGFRYAYFFNEIKAQSTTEYIYKDIDTKTLEEIMQTSKLNGYDAVVSKDQKDEDEIIDHILNERWNKLPEVNNSKNKGYYKVNRRGIFKAFSALRNFYKRGDL